MSPAPSVCPRCKNAWVAAHGSAGPQGARCASCGHWVPEAASATAPPALQGQGGPVPQEASTGAPGRLVGVYEMFWDCAFCDAKALLGKTNRFCPNCGAPQDPTKRYFPPPGKEVAANTQYDGVDLSCPACQNPNGAKARCCKNCGSPLTEAARVALIQEKAARPQPPPTAAPATKNARKWPWIVGAVIALLIASCLVSAFWTRDVKATVSGRTWERTIDIERKKAVAESSWCDSTPSDAYSVSQRREQRSTRQIPDGQECTTQNVDRGNGTFERRETCRTKYKSEPVYDNKCYYTVDRWRTDHTLREAGSFSDAPRWPTVALARPGNALGCDREGPHREKYVVALKGPKSESYECSKPESTWRAFQDGKAYPLKVGVVLGDAKCDSLQP